MLPGRIRPGTARCRRHRSAPRLGQGAAVDLFFFTSVCSLPPWSKGGGASLDCRAWAPGSAPQLLASACSGGVWHVDGLPWEVGAAGNFAPMLDNDDPWYAYAVASALHGVGNILHKDFMIQPPWDLEVGDTFIIHYTYGCDYDKTGKLTYGKIGEWRFDKRSYTDKPPPRNLQLPPNGVPQSVVTLVKMVNEATDNIPNWDSYAAAI